MGALIGAVDGFPEGSAPVDGRAVPVAGGSEWPGGFSEAVGVRSEPDAAGNGAVPGREGASPVERCSIAVGGRTALVGDFPGADGARVTPAGGRMEPGGAWAAPAGDPADENDEVGGFSEVVGGRVEPAVGGALSVRRIEPVAGRFEGRDGALGAGEAGWAGAGTFPVGVRSAPERGNSVTRGMSGEVVVGEIGVAGTLRGRGDVVGHGQAGEKIKGCFPPRRSWRRWKRA